MIFLFIMLAILIGSLMPFQAAINAELTRSLKHPFLGAFISFLTGTLAISLVILLKSDGFSSLKKLSAIPPLYFIGGILGATFVGSSIFFVPRLGAMTMIVCFIIGQLVTSVILDHYGLLGLPTFPVTPQRLWGLLLLFAGLALVVKSPA